MALLTGENGDTENSQQVEADYNWMKNVGLEKIFQIWLLENLKFGSVMGAANSWSLRVANRQELA